MGVEHCTRGSFRCLVEALLCCSRAYMEQQAPPLELGASATRSIQIAIHPCLLCLLSYRCYSVSHKSLSDNLHTVAPTGGLRKRFRHTWAAPKSVTLSLRSFISFLPVYLDISCLDKEWQNLWHSPIIPHNHRSRKGVKKTSNGVTISSGLPAVKNNLYIVTEQNSDSYYLFQVLLATQSCIFNC
jgi:hypothetical protein